MTRPDAPPDAETDLPATGMPVPSKRAQAGSTLASSRAEALRTRQCALTRAELPVDDLIRFVLGPDGRLAPDLAMKLGGRGVWVTATRSAVTEAVRRGAFSKALKTHIKADQALADVVEDQLIERARQALSFAAKAGVITCGFVKVDVALDAGAVAALVQANDASNDGVERLWRKFSAIMTAASRPAPHIRQFAIADLSMALGRPNVVHACLADGGQTRALLRACHRLERFRKTDEATGVSVPDDRPERPLD